MLDIQYLRRNLEISAKSEHTLEDLRDEVIDLFNNETGITYSEGTFTQEIKRLEDQTVISLNYRPVTEIVSVHGSNDGINFTELDESQFGLRKESHLLLSDSVTYSQIRAIIRSGFTDETCPKSLKRALVNQIRYSMKRNSFDAIAIQSQNSRGGAGTYLEGPFHPDFEAAVDRYIRIFP